MTPTVKSQQQRTYDKGTYKEYVLEIDARTPGIAMKRARVWTRRQHPRVLSGPEITTVEKSDYEQYKDRKFRGTPYFRETYHVKVRLYV